MFDKLEVFETRYEELNQKMYDPSIVSNPDVYTEIMKEYKNLTPLVEKYREYKKRPGKCSQKAEWIRISVKWWN